MKPSLSGFIPDVRRGEESGGTPPTPPAPSATPTMAHSNVRRGAVAFQKPNRFDRKHLFLALFVLGIVAFGLGFGATWLVDNSSMSLALRPPTSTATPAPTSAPVPTFTPTLPPPTATVTPAPPTPTNTRVVPRNVDYAATAQFKKQATTQARSEGQPAAQVQLLPQINMQPKITNPQAMSHTRGSRLVLAHYFAWFDGNGWDACNISAGDKPLHPYHSDDPAAIARHARMAYEIGLNGFTVHWFAPGDRTDRNFTTLLTQSEGTDFASTVVFSHHIWHGRPHDIPGALRYITTQHGPHPNFLRLDGKPVIFFTDVYRTPAPGQTPQQYWASVRDQVDPQRQTVWIAEGLDASYLNVFDGLYVFKVSHAAYPHDYRKNAIWGNRVRQWEQKTGQSKLWIATISPGWDDLRSGCKPDVRIDNTSHRLDRDNGAIYEANFTAALEGNPNWLIVASFNEWVEGTYIEPSVQYGDQYMQMTKAFVRRFQGR